MGTIRSDAEMCLAVFLCYRRKSVADIKTRDVTRGSIKTLDRAASSMHHLKEEIIKGKYMGPGRGQDEHSGDSYAENRVEQYVGDGAAYASRSGIDMLLHSREQTNGYPAEFDHRGGPKPPVVPDTGIGSQEQIQRAFREQGVKDILERRNKSRMADKEVVRTAEESSYMGQVRSVSIGRRDRAQSKAAGKIAKSSNTIQKKDELIQRIRKEHAIKRIVGRKETAGYSILSLVRPSGAYGNSRRAKTLSSFIKFMWENAKTAIMTLGAGGAATVIVLILFVFFTIGAISFSNNSPDTSATDDPEAIEYFIPDLAGSPTRAAIVKAASREVGNVGGEKFWRWFGFKNHVHWCACFTSYIAAECGCINSGVCPKSAVVSGWIDFYKKQHRWAGRNYIPHSGDFIIFDWEGDGEPDHIGIVESCDGKKVFTIEGNSRDVCKRKSYARGSGLIYGYGCPNYSGL